jgi:hypothetical protein
MSEELKYADRLSLAREYVAMYLEELPGDDWTGACIKAAEAWSGDYAQWLADDEMPFYRRMITDLFAWQVRLREGVDK